MCLFNQSEEAMMIWCAFHYRKYRSFVLSNITSSTEGSRTSRHRGVIISLSYRRIDVVFVEIQCSHSHCTLTDSFSLSLLSISSTYLLLYPTALQCQCNTIPSLCVSSILRRPITNPIYVIISSSESMNANHSMK